MRDLPVASSTWEAKKVPLHGRQARCADTEETHMEHAQRLACRADESKELWESMGYSVVPSCRRRLPTEDGGPVGRTDDDGD